MRPLLFIAVFLLTISCGKRQQNQQAILPPDFENEFSLDTSVKFQNVRHVAYGYSFSYPLSFIEIPDTIGQVDSFVLYSQDGLTKIKFFVEGDTEKNMNQKDEKEKHFFKQYFDSLAKSKHAFTKTAKIIKSTFRFKNYEYGDPASFILFGEREATEVIMKTELSEVPISGDLTLKSFAMEYPKTQKSHFRPIALEIAKSFGQ